MLNCKKIETILSNQYSKMYDGILEEISEYPKTFKFEFTRNSLYFYYRFSY